MYNVENMPFSTSIVYQKKENTFLHYNCTLLKVIASVFIKKHNQNLKEH